MIAPNRHPVCHWSKKQLNIASCDSTQQVSQLPFVEKTAKALYLIAPIPFRTKYYLHNCSAECRKTTRLRPSRWCPRPTLLGTPPGASPSRRPSEPDAGISITAPREVRPITRVLQTAATSAGAASVHAEPSVLDGAVARRFLSFYFWYELSERRVWYFFLCRSIAATFCRLASHHSPQARTTVGLKSLVQQAWSFRKETVTHFTCVVDGCYLRVSIASGVWN